MLARLLPLAFDPATEPAPALRQALSVGLEAFAGVGPAATRALVGHSCGNAVELTLGSGIDILLMVIMLALMAMHVRAHEVVDTQ